MVEGLMGYVIGFICATLIFTTCISSGRGLCEQQFKGEFINGKCYKPVVREEMK